MLRYVDCWDDSMHILVNLLNGRQTTWRYAWIVIHSRNLGKFMLFYLDWQHQDIMSLRCETEPGCCRNRICPSSSESGCQSCTNMVDWMRVPCRSSWEHIDFKSKYTKASFDSTDLWQVVYHWKCFTWHSHLNERRRWLSVKRANIIVS